MLANKVDATLSAQDVQEVIAALEIIRSKLEFAVGLSPKERRQLTKIGRKSQTFTEQALNMAERYPNLIPPELDLAAARRDMDLFIALHPVVQALSVLFHLAEDTQMVAGSEAFAVARMAYKSAKTMGTGMGLDDVLGDLSLRFQKSPSVRQNSSTVD